ncbi:MarR family winged helix-turn-helix transcriptional regulator [Actinomadura mexicana]|uniref:DNA-binding transcriptional regulator, MarR family n=1 Tax=Actinomadura mexicana TaxID=134959 RepID=A0A239GNK7_9ACTN|nr:MarR family winged helix-turn-helix transcriptional regulator [Actinomadura mexicana]SNS70455.1 DNA-binding transcriptional regulator, MarR family [Actinomadura mexicana]
MAEGAEETRRPAGLRSFAVELRRLNAEFNRIAHAFAHASGLHPTDVQALVAIMDARRRTPDRPMTPGRLREELNVTSGAVTACLDRLERLGHISRARDPADRRVVHLRYEPSAMTMAREYFRPLSESTEAARGGFSEDELSIILRFLRAMNEELSNLRARGPDR